MCAHCTRRIGPVRPIADSPTAEIGSVAFAVGYPREWLKRCEGAEVPDLLGGDCRLLFVGINPGLSTALVGVHFGHPSNRFWPALKRAGLIDWQPNLQPDMPAVPIDSSVSGDSGYEPRHDRRTPGTVDWGTDSSEGMSGSQRRSFVELGVGITNLVNRATARASELEREELRQGAQRLIRLVERQRPRVVAMAGITAYRDAFRAPKAEMGRQPERLGPSELWVVPNPSGLNAHETTDSLAEWFGEVAEAAGVR